MFAVKSTKLCLFQCLMTSKDHQNRVVCAKNMYFGIPVSHIQLFCVIARIN